MMRRFTGTSVVPGLGVGRAVVLVRRGQTLRAPIAEGRVEDELGRLERARAESRQQLVAIRERLAKGRGADLAAIFDAQILMLDDPLLTGRAALLIREERANAEWAVQRALDELSRLFENLDDPYLRERGGDVADLIGRLRMNLRGGSRGWQDVLAQGDGPFVIVADDPSPSVAAQVDWSLVRGLAIDGGSRTSHTAILARSLGIPTVVGLGDASMQVTPGEMVALDGEDGVLVIGPDDLELAAMTRRQATRTSAQYPARPAGPGTSATRDGVRVRLEANVDRFEDVASALNAGADGVGLFRSESLLLTGTVQGLAGAASEAQQAEAYGRVIAAFAPAPVTIRTFDIDLAQAAALTSGVPSHPALERHRPLGLRGIRLGLAQPAILDTQFRAILRVASRGRVRILLPFVTSASEVRAARVRLDAAREALRAEGVATPEVPLGAMIEVPAAALTADLLAVDAEFLALGTNDLAQYLLAVDRTDERVAAIAEPFHPALLRVLRRLPRLAGRRHVPLSVCGEAASDPVLLSLLVGFGVREFSMTPAALPGAWRVLADSDSRELASAAREAAVKGTLAPVEAYLAGASTVRR